MVVWNMKRTWARCDKLLQYLITSSACRTRAKKVAIKTEPIDNEISTSTSNNETSQQKGGSRISLSSGSNLNRENTNTAEAAPAAFNRAEYEALHARYAILCKERYGNRDLDMEDWNPPPPIPVIEFEDGRIPTVEALSTMIRARGGFFPLPGEASTSALPVASRPAIAPMRQADAEEPHSEDVVEVAKKVARPRRAKAATRTRRVKAANLGQLQEGKTRLQAGTAERTAGRKNEGAKVTNGGGAKMEDDPIHTTAPEPVRTEAGPMTRSRTKKARIHGSDEDPGVREGVMTRSQTKAKRDREEEDMGNRRSKRARKTR